METVSTDVLAPAALSSLSSTLALTKTVVVATVVLGLLLTAYVLSIIMARRTASAKVPEELAGAAAGASDIELGLTTSEKKGTGNVSPSGRGSGGVVGSLMQFFIAQESASEAGSDAEEGPFELDDSSWLAPPEGPEEHFIGDTPRGAAPERLPMADAAEAATDAFGLADELWRAPPGCTEETTA